MRFVKLILIALIAVLAAACAPENLDITPTPTPTETPTPRPTVPPTPTPDPAAAASSAAEATEAPVAASLLDTILAGLPTTFSVNGVTWRVDADATEFREETGGRAVFIEVNEPQGGQARVHFGDFESVEAATAYLNDQLATVRTMENANPREDFPSPNGFAIGGTYGSESVWLREALFVRVQVLRFNSGSGNPLLPLSRAVQGALDDLGIPTGM